MLVPDPVTGQEVMYVYKQRRTDPATGKYVPWVGPPKVNVASFLADKKWWIIGGVGGLVVLLLLLKKR